jgi:hypothetical protein
LAGQDIAGKIMGDFKVYSNRFLLIGNINI